MKQNTFEILFREGGEEIKYLFDKTSPDVEFVKYIKNAVISETPRVELIEEEWHIKSLDKNIKLSRKYTFNNKIGERRNWKQYGSLSSDKSSVGEDVFLEWMPSMLSFPENLKKVRSIVELYEKYKYNISAMPVDFDLIFINTSYSDRLSMLYKSRYEDLIYDVNRISDKLLHRNKKLNRNGLTITEDIPDNEYNENNENIANKINTMREIAKTNTSEGLFVPVHLRSGYKNIMEKDSSNMSVSASTENVNEFEPSTDNTKLFQVPKVKPKKYTFVIKDIPDPNNKTEQDIIDVLMNYSMTLQDNPRAVSVYILKNKSSGRNKNMCLVNFKKENIKKQVFEECTRCKITMDNTVLIIEDGKKNN